jgi:hypothetical protein
MEEYLPWAVAILPGFVVIALVVLHYRLRRRKLPRRALPTVIATVAAAVLGIVVVTLFTLQSSWS